MKKDISEIIKTAQKTSTEHEIWLKTGESFIKTRLVVEEKQKDLETLKKARDLADSIQYEEDKFYALSNISESYAKIGEIRRDLKILEKATKIAVTMRGKFKKFHPLGEIAES